MGKSLVIKGVDFGPVAVGDVNIESGNENWIMHIHDVLSTLPPAYGRNPGAYFFGDNFTYGENYFSGKTLSRIICRFSNGENAAEVIGDIATIYIGYCDTDGSNATPLTSVKAINGVATPLKEYITIPVGKTLYFYCTDRHIKVIEEATYTALNLPHGLKTVEAPQTSLSNGIMLDFFEVEQNV